MKYVLITGNLTLGFTHLGPFDSVQNAENWKDLTCPISHWQIVPLFDPIPAGKKVDSDWDKIGEEGGDL